MQHAATSYTNRGYADFGAKRGRGVRYRDGLGRWLGPRKPANRDRIAGNSLLCGRLRTYSCRSASIGSSLAALWAGHSPKKMPTAALKAKATTIDSGEIRVFQP